ncbi:MAG: acyl-CoA thioesterase [Lachnospiraceae bacterium]
MISIKPYIHHANYYETDQMGIIHHSNYIRWMEEARIDFMSQLGFSYQKTEELGIVSPVLSVQVQYKQPVHFAEDVQIEISNVSYNGIKLELHYTMTNLATGKVCTLSSSQHCFLNKEGKILSLKRSCPELHQIFSEYAAQQSN